MGVGGHIVDAFRNLGGVHFPVAEAGVVPVAGIVLREPAVVQDEHLEAHGGRVVDHPKKGFGREGEVGAFPAVQEGGIDLPASVNAVVPGPCMQVARGLPRPFAREGIDEIRRRKRLSCSEFVGRSKRADSGQDRETAGLVLLEGETEIAAPGEGAGDDVTHILLQPVRIEAHQERGIRALGHLRPAAGFNDLRVMLQELAVHLHLIGPAAVEMREIVLVRVQVQGAGSVVEQLRGLLAGILDFRMGADDILLLVGVIAQLDFQRSDGILQGDFRRDDVAVRADLVIRIDQFRVMVAVGILHVEGGLAEITPAGGGIGHRPFPVVGPPSRPEGRKGRRVGDLRAEMDRLQYAVLLRDEDKLRVRRLHGDDGLAGRCRPSEDEGREGRDRPMQVFHSQCFVNRQTPSRRTGRTHARSGPRRRAGSGRPGRCSGRFPGRRRCRTSSLPTRGRS